MDHSSLEANHLAATSSNNYSPQAFKFNGLYWDGAASQVDTWQVGQVLNSGANPISYFQISHSGSSGSNYVFIPGLIYFGSASSILY